MIYKANIREIFGSRLGGKGAYIYTLYESREAQCNWEAQKTERFGQLSEIGQRTKYTKIKMIIN